VAEGGVALEEIDLVAFYDKPVLKFERLLETYLEFAPRGFESFKMAVPIWLREKLLLKDLLANQLRQHRPDFDWDKRLVFSEQITEYYDQDGVLVVTARGVGVVTERPGE